jgi:hypothetical protein
MAIVRQFAACFTKPLEVYRIRSQYAICLAEASMVHIS